MNEDIQKTVHYTTNSSQIIDTLIKYIPEDALLVEPFCGQGDLVKLFPEHTWETYDIMIDGHDSLLDPPDYHSKWVITNPPYLAKNKSKDKTLFALYDLDDLYKISLETFKGCEGGIVIIPSNFFFDKYSKTIRESFLSEYRIFECVLYTEPIFESTSYSICAFAFQKSSDTERQEFKVEIRPECKIVHFCLEKRYGYRYGGEFYSRYENYPSNFGRVVSEDDSKATHITLNCLDQRGKPFHAYWTETPFVGKATDRMKCTLTYSYPLSGPEQKRLILLFNDYTDKIRAEFNNLIFTNYRDFGRKRIEFDLVYRIFQKLLDDMKDGDAD